ncbi:hypothetical protein ACVR0A_08800, partial [Streptococcus downei]
VIVTVHEVAFLLFFCQRYFIKTTYVKQKATASKPLLFRWLRDGFVPSSFLRLFCPALVSLDYN